MPIWPLLLDTLSLPEASPQTNITLMFLALAPVTIRLKIPSDFVELGRMR